VAWGPAPQKMDNLTHTLFAATLIRTSLGRAGRGTTAALILASNAPDIDILAAAGGGITYLAWHRGPTHGPIGIVGLGLVTAGLVWTGRRVLDRKRTDTPVADASFGTLAVVSMTSVLLHILMDLPTSYGTRLLSPFDWHWFAADWLPIVDIYLLMALAAGLVFGRGSEAARRRNAAIALVLMMANYGVRAAAHQQALAEAPRLFGPLLPRRCDAATPGGSVIDRWPRDTPSSPRDLSGGRCLVEFAAMPTFVSPFRWRVIAQLSNVYEIHDIDLLSQRFRASATAPEVTSPTTLRYPNIWTPAVVRASATRLGLVFLGFSRFPAARSLVDLNGIATVWWSDMRFVGGAIALDQPAGRGNLFTAVVRIGADGQILQAQLGR